MTHYHCGTFRMIYHDILQLIYKPIYNQHVGTQPSRPKKMMYMCNSCQNILIMLNDTTYANYVNVRWPQKEISSLHYQKCLCNL